MGKFNNLRILIIDDNPEIHQDFIRILTKDRSRKNDKKHLEEIGKKLFEEESDTSKMVLLPDFLIDTASQGQEGVEYIAKAKKEGNPYALAFVDIRMPPGWDGIETIKHIWEIDPEIQIVICTAYSDYSWEETVQELGERENLLILKKPFDYVAVRQLSMALTKKWQLAQEKYAYTQLLEQRVEERTELLEYQATHDVLTDLSNRGSLINFIHNQIIKSDRKKSKFAVLFFDLDRFKLINDSFSHAVGDELLVKVANRIKKNLREEDFIARLGGDEFVFVTPFISIEKLLKIANKFLTIFKEPFKIRQHEIIISPSIGISIFPDNGKTVDELLRNADIAMYYAKELGGGQIQFFTKDLNHETLQRLEMETDLHLALKNEEFFLCYQPQYNLAENKLMSVEALIRWMHPKKGVILPIDFIPLAEEIGLIASISEWVLRRACKQNKEWQNAGLPFIRMAVNITTQEFIQPNFVSLIKNILEETQLKPEYLELELTENIIINSANSVNKIRELKQLGVSIAVDDFGTGYSSLNYLRKVPIDRLKIDQSFIKNININRGDEVIIQAIINMATDLNLEILAEGVETQKQIDFLKSKQCVEVQGFYFSEPLDVKGLENLLKNSKRIISESDK